MDRSPRSDAFTVASVQMHPVFGDKIANVRRTEELAARAVAAGAELLVLPELCSTGYMFASRDEALELAELVPEGPTVEAWTQLCRSHDVHLVAGIAEREGDLLFNSSVLIGPTGYLGTYRKVHLWGEEKLTFEPGNLRFPVFDTSLGRLAMLICYDGWFPESARSCVLAGADVICVPTNWVPMADQPPQRDAMATVLTMGAAHTNGIYIIAADRVGTERGQPFEGQSLIVDHRGWPIAGPASRADEEILLATISPREARASRQWSHFNNPVTDRRPEAYRSLSGE